MNLEELKQLIAGGEHSGVEFKRDELSSEKLAREMVAFSNLKGGFILLGVEDDGTISGLKRSDCEEWVMEIARNKVSPPILPFFQKVLLPETGMAVGVIELAPSPTKPCRLVHEGRKTAFIRVGSTVREPGDEELAQMYQASLRFNYGKIPVLGSVFGDFDHARLKTYLHRVLGYEVFASLEEEVTTLVNLEVMAATDKGSVPSVNGILLFGKQPKHFVPQAGVRAIAYRGTEEDYAAIEDTDFDCPIVPELSGEGKIVEPGLIERVLSFVARHAPPVQPLEGGRSIHTSIYPDSVLREVVTNAIAHRDYTIAGADILVNVFSNRLEIKSPGRLPNGATVESVKSGFRYYRNQVLVNVLRDLKYVDARGMGLRLKVIPIMKKLTGREPEFRLTDYDFTVVLPLPGTDW